MNNIGTTLRVPRRDTNSVTQVTTSRVIDVTRTLAITLIALAISCGGAAPAPQTTASTRSPAATRAVSGAAASSAVGAATGTIARVSANKASNADLISA